MTDDLSKKDENIKKKIDDSLNYSIKDASWWAIMFGFGESYLSAFAVFLRASAFQMSMFAALPQLFSAIIQIFSVKLTNWFKSRKKIILVFSLAQAFTWLIIISISYWTMNVWILILLVALYFTFGSLPGPAWTSWMGDLVPEKKRGRYFGLRNRITGFISFIAILGGGFFLNKFSGINEFLGFTIIFSIAFFARLISFYYLSRKYEPLVEIREPQGENILSFLKEMHKTNFGVFTMYNSFMHIAIFIASPLFVIYWLNYLQFSYLEYTALIAAASITSFITISYWGAYADHYGNKIILIIGSYLLSILPLAWFFLHLFPNTIIFPLALLIQIISGFAWAGFNISAGNLQYDTIEPEHRVRLISYHNTIKGVALFIGSMIGGAISWLTLPNIDFINTFFPSAIFLAMIISFIARFSVINIFAKKIAETKFVDKYPHFLHFIAIMPVQGLVFDSVIGMNRTLKRFTQHLRKIESKLDFWEGDLKKKTKNEDDENNNS